jgi:hypothetical protein
LCEASAGAAPTAAISARSEATRESTAAMAVELRRTCRSEFMDIPEIENNSKETKGGILGSVKVRADER